MVTARYVVVTARYLVVTAHYHLLLFVSIAFSMNALKSVLLNLKSLYLSFHMLFLLLLIISTVLTTLFKEFISKN